ncbi:hypothetical protein [Bradyrhizobium sp. 157]|nr:hypothetical protein [Bradyrhizobium sp. 157]
MICFEFKGGTGTSSRLVGYSVTAIQSDARYKRTLAFDRSSIFLEYQ